MIAGLVRKINLILGPQFLALDEPTSAPELDKV
jgi:hypothetical protein